MNRDNKVGWIIFMLLMALVWWLVLVNLIKGGASYHSSVKVDSSGSYVSQNDRLQPTAPVQRTQSGAQLHKLSEGVEMRPIEMLRSGKL